MTIDIVREASSTQCKNKNKQQSEREGLCGGRSVMGKRKRKKKISIAFHPIVSFNLNSPSLVSAVLLLLNTSGDGNTIDLLSLLFSFPFPQRLTKCKSHLLEDVRKRIETTEQEEDRKKEIVVLYH
jgi:hypothetical protein